MGPHDANKGYAPVVTEVIRLVHLHGPLTVRTVSRVLRVPADEIRRQVNAFDQDVTSPSLDPVVPTEVFIEWAGDDPDDETDLIKVTGDPERDLLGVEMFGAAVYGPLLESAWDLLNREPRNAGLRSACEKLHRQFLPGVEAPYTFAAEVVAGLQTALDQQREVRLVYSRAWEPGVTDRVVQPYGLTVTSRGYELDAGPVQDNGRIRTFLVSRIRDYEVLDSGFERPDDAEALIDENRRTSTVTGYLPHAGSWVLRKWAESFEKGAADDGGFVFTAEMLPPVAWRAALVRLLGGATASLDDEEYNAEARLLAEHLAAHHGLDL